ncbi:MAG TPA: hypothetical protein P5208_03720 [Smithellaceae bacterium]|nr:hypothetical protein [Smithellaceae bacterium]
MRTRAVLLFVFLLAAMPAWLYAEKMTGHWQLTGYTKYRDAVFVDRGRISQPAPDRTAAWIKIAPSGKSRYRDVVAQYLQSVNKWNPRWKSVEIRCEINCSGNLIRYTEFVYLDDDQNMLHEARDVQASWFRINPGSTWHWVQREVCGRP